MASASHSPAAAAPLPVAKRLRITGKASPFYEKLLSAMGSEDANANQMVYLVTVSRMLPGAAVGGCYRDLEKLSRRELADAIRDAFEKPVSTAARAGRPRTREGPLVCRCLLKTKFPEDSGVWDFRGHAGL